MHDDDVLNGAKAIALLDGYTASDYEHRLDFDLQQEYLRRSRAVLESLPKIETPADLTLAVLEMFVEKSERAKSDDDWRHVDLEAMTAALRLFVNDSRVRPVITDEEIERRVHVICAAPMSWTLGARWYRAELQKRIDALLSPPAARPWSERIIVSENADYARVLVDGERAYSFEQQGPDFKEFRQTATKHAEIYRLGLIAQKEQEDAR